MDVWSSLKCVCLSLVCIFFENKFQFQFDYRTAGRRGLAGAILFLKIVGAMAKSGKSLTEILEICERDILPNLGTIGVCLRPCIVPGNETSSFELGDEEMEVGISVS